MRKSVVLGSVAMVVVALSSPVASARTESRSGAGRSFAEIRDAINGKNLTADQRSEIEKEVKTGKLELAEQRRLLEMLASISRGQQAANAASTRLNAKSTTNVDLVEAAKKATVKKAPGAKVDPYLAKLGEILSITAAEAKALSEMPYMKQLEEFARSQTGQGLADLDPSAKFGFSLPRPRGGAANSTEFFTAGHVMRVIGLIHRGSIPRVVAIAFFGGKTVLGPNSAEINQPGQAAAFVKLFLETMDTYLAVKQKSQPTAHDLSVVTNIGELVHEFLGNPKSALAAFNLREILRKVELEGKALNRANASPAQLGDLAKELNVDPSQLSAFGVLAAQQIREFARKTGMSEEQTRKALWCLARNRA